MEKITFDRNYIYEIGVYSVGHTDCESRGCDKDDYCRCSRITGISFVNDNINSYELAKLIVGNIQLSDLQLYAIERYCRFNITNNSFDFEAENGYYGQELLSVTLYDADKHDEQINKLIKLSPEDMLTNVLNMEYEKYKKTYFGEIKEVVVLKNFDISTIIISNNYHYENIKIPSEYVKSNPIFPICVCKYVNGEAVLVDGYHRVKAANNSKSFADIILMEKN